MQEPPDRMEEVTSRKDGAARALADERNPTRVARALTPVLPQPNDVESFEPELTRRLTDASLWAFVIYVGGAGVTCLAQLIVARLIGTASYGIYSYAVAWMTLLSYIAALGFNTVLLRFVPAYDATGRWPFAYGLIRFAFGRSALLATLISIGGIAVVLLFSDNHHQELTLSLVIAIATVPLVAVYVLCAATVRAFGGVVLAVAPERLGRDGLMVVLVLIAAALHATAINATTVLLALTASSAVTAAVLGLTMRKLWPPQLRGAAPSYARADWWHLAIPVMVMIGVEVLMSRAGLILLGWAGDNHAAGLFALALNLALFLVLPRVAVGTFFSPNVSKLHAHRNEAALQSLFARATVLSLLGTAVLAVPLLVLTEPLLRFFGEEFAAAAPMAQVLILGQIFAAATGPQQYLLTMTGHERAAAAIMLIGAVFNLSACAIAISYFGALGAAVATATTNVVWNAAMAIYIYKRVNVVAGLLFAVLQLHHGAAR